MFVCAYMLLSMSYTVKFCFVLFGLFEIQYGAGYQGYLDGYLALNYCTWSKVQQCQLSQVFISEKISMLVNL